MTLTLAKSTCFHLHLPTLSPTIYIQITNWPYLKSTEEVQDEAGAKQCHAMGICNEQNSSQEKTKMMLMAQRIVENYEDL